LKNAFTFNAYMRGNTVDRQLFHIAPTPVFNSL